MAEFTGERVVPGRVEVDLWNEHYSRYVFASRLVENRVVLDVGCGTGYGSFLLAGKARKVVGVDCAVEAIDYARSHYVHPRLSFLQADACQLPFHSRSFEVVVAFEVVEHLSAWQAFLAEVAQVLTSEGLALISTPNRLFYAEARKETGPNPFHVHEFDFEEFQQALRRFFPCVEIWLQNHSDVQLFVPAHNRSISYEGMLESPEVNVENAHFFVALCSLTKLPEIRKGFGFAPRAANIMHEWRRHIEQLNSEVAGLRERVVELQEELEQSNQWALKLDRELKEAYKRIEEAHQQIKQLEEEIRAKNQWALQLDAELNECRRLLDQAEKTVVERTEWALRLDQENQVLKGLVEAYRQSRWVRLGKKLRLGPEAKG